MKTKYLSLALLLCMMSSQHRAFGAKGTKQTPPTTQPKSGILGWFRKGPKAPKVISATDKEALNKQLWDLTEKGEEKTTKAIFDYIQQKIAESRGSQYPYFFQHLNSAEEAKEYIRSHINILTERGKQEAAIAFYKAELTAIDELITAHTEDHAAYVKKCTSTIKTLMEKGADPTAVFVNYKSEKTSSLGNALRNNELEILEVLLGEDNKGITNPNAIDGKSLLAYAGNPETQNPKAVKILVERTQQNTARDKHKEKQSEEAPK